MYLRLFMIASMVAPVAASAQDLVVMRRVIGVPSKQASAGGSTGQTARRCADLASKRWTDDQTGYEILASGVNSVTTAQDMCETAAKGRANGFLCGYNAASKTLYRFDYGRISTSTFATDNAAACTGS